MRNTSRRQAIVASSALVVAIVVGSAYISSRAASGPSDRNDNTARTVRPTPPPNSSKPPAVPTPVVTAPGQSQVIEPGNVILDEDVADLTTALEPATTRSLDGAAAAFTSFATWLIASPAAKAEPSLAVEEVGGESMLDFASAQMLTNMSRAPSDDFQPELGAYRILGHSASETRPEGVMVEVVAPLTTGDKSTRWVIVGGVVRWTAGEWTLGSISPRELKTQPRGVESLTSPDADTSWLDGLGWKTFTSSDTE